MKICCKIFQIVLISLIVLGISSSSGATYTVETYGTIHCAGIRIRPTPDEVTKVTLQYRKQGDTSWKQGLDPVITFANSLLE